MATYIKPEAIKDASLPIGKVAAMSEDERLAFLDLLGISNNWELIETITLEQEVSVIEKSIEPNGKAYSFKNIAVIISNVEQPSWKSQIWLQLLFDKDLVKASIQPYGGPRGLMGFRDNCTFANPDVKMIARLVNNNNVMQIGISNPITNPGYLNGYPDLRSSDIAINNMNAKVSSLTLKSPSMAFLVNTKITIYGIR